MEKEIKMGKKKKNIHQITPSVSSSTPCIQDSGSRLRNLGITSTPDVPLDYAQHTYTKPITRSLVRL